MRVYEKIIVRLKRMIRQNHKAGDRLPPIRQLASRFRVSPVAICQSLAVLTHEGLVERRVGSGVYVREQVDERPVGVVLGIDFAIPGSSYFWRQLTQEVRLRLAEQGVRSRLYAGFWRPERGDGYPLCQELNDDIVNDRLRAVACVSGPFLPGWDTVLRERGVPMVAYGRETGGDRDFSVNLDYSGMIREATARLIAAGRRKLAFITWTGPLGSGLRQPNLHLEAFASVLAEHHLPLNEHWVREEFSPHLTGGTWEEFREIWTGSDEKPDGLIVTDDVLFRGVAKAVGELGIRVPEQLLIVTQANRGAIEECPFPTWRMVSDPDLVGQAMVDLLLPLLRRQPIPNSQIRLPVQLEIPDSSNADPSAVEPITQMRS